MRTRHGARSAIVPPMRRTSRPGVLALLVTLGCGPLGCGGGEEPDDSGARADSGPTLDASVADDTGAGLDAGSGLDTGAPLDAASGPDAAVASRCSGSHAPPDLDGVTLATIDAVPIRDGFAAGWGIVEGPVWTGEALLVSHFGGGATPSARLYRIAADGAVSVARTDAGTNGLAMGPDGALYGASHALGAIVRFDLGDLAAEPTVVIGMHDGARLNGPNDLVIGRSGAIYFTDPDYQAPSPRPQRATRAYRLADGVLEVIADDLSQPNGIALSLDERTLYLGHAGGLVRYPLDAEGAIAGARTSVAAITRGVDGLGRDCAGDLYVTTNGSVVVLDPDDAELGRLDAPGATNVAFGGPDGRTLYVTSLGDPPRLRTATLDVVGLPD